MILKLKNIYIMPPKKKPNEKSNEKKCDLCLGDIKANEDALVCSEIH